MNMKKVLRIIVILLILATNIGCDQVSKNIVREKIDYNEQIGLLDNHLTLTKVENTGAFLSMGHSLPKPARVILMMILPLIALGMGAAFILKRSSSSGLMILGISCIVGGGIGNLYDRIVHGSVTDFMHIDFVIFQTGIFNMADVSITAGTFILLASMIFKHYNINFAIFGSKLNR